MNKSFYRTLTDKMEGHDPKLTIFTLSNEIQYDYVALYKMFVNNSPDVALAIKLNRYFKCSDFSKFTGN